MVIVKSKRDQRVHAWLVEQVGYEAIAQAEARLAGGRLAYPSNLSKVLGLVPPERLKYASQEDVAAHIEEIRQILGVRS